MSSLTNIDDIIKAFGIKYVSMASGPHAIKEKISEVFDNKIPSTLSEDQLKFWCEFSWADNNGELLDVAVNDFGATPGEAIENCIKNFILHVRHGNQSFVKVAKHYKIYNWLISL